MSAYLVDARAIAHVVLAAQSVGTDLVPRENAVACGEAVLETLVEKCLAHRVDASEVEALRAKVEAYEAALRSITENCDNDEVSTGVLGRVARNALARFNP